MADRERITTLSLDDWKARAKDGTQPNECRLVKSYAGVIERAEGDESKSAPIKIRISTATRDRDRDTISASGWQLDNYRKNPVVLFAHGYRTLPIGRDTGLSIDERGLVGSPEFCPDDMNPLGPMVERMLRGGFLNAASIGMMPITWQYNEEERGVDFLTQELLEYSIVPVPANPGALVEARSAGIDLAPLKGWVEQMLAETLGAETIIIPKGQLEQAYRIVTNERVMFAVPVPQKAATAPAPEPKNPTPAKQDPPTPSPEAKGSGESEDVIEFAADCFDAPIKDTVDPDAFELPEGFDLEKELDVLVDDRAQRLMTALTGRLD